MNMPTIPSVFDISEWFLDTALKNKESLQVLKMQYLMYLSQAYYAGLTGGLRFIPSIFIATKQGPVEPSSFRFYEYGDKVHSAFPVNSLTHFYLEQIWARYSPYSTEQLFEKISVHEPVLAAKQTGQNTEIDLKKMAVYYKSVVQNDKLFSFVNSPKEKLVPAKMKDAKNLKKWFPNQNK